RGGAGGGGRRVLPALGGGGGGAGGRGGLAGIASGLRLPAYRAALAANLADSWASMGVRSALVPLFVVDSLHRSPLVTGAGFVVVAALNAAVLLPAGRVADTRGRRPVLIAGLLLSASALALLAGVGGLAGYFSAMAVLGIGSGLLDVAPAAVVGDIAGDRGGPLVAGYQMSGDLGTVSGPLAAGWLADAVSYQAAFAASAVVVALASIFAFLAPETHHGPPQSSAPERAQQVLD
ncbi:MAG: MFS transporter, partial [Mycobacteriales bacterium]